MPELVIGRPEAASPLAESPAKVRPVMLLTFDVPFDHHAVDFAVETAAETGAELYICDGVPVPTGNPAVVASRTFGNSETRAASEAVAREAWRSASELIRAGQHRIVILDEITYPMNWGWVATADFVEAIRSRPADVTIVATGRDAPAELREIADTVTEMVSEKHAFDEGIAAMRGIEF